MDLFALYLHVQVEDDNAELCDAQEYPRHVPQISPDLQLQLALTAVGGSLFFYQAELDKLVYLKGDGGL